MIEKASDKTGWKIPGESFCIHLEMQKRKCEQETKNPLMKFIAMWRKLSLALDQCRRDDVK